MLATSPQGRYQIRPRAIRWIAPQILRPDDPAPTRGRLLLWTDEYVRFPKVTVRQDGRAIARRTLPWPAAPGRVFRVPSSLLDGVSQAAGPVQIGLKARRVSKSVVAPSLRTTVASGRSSAP
ncbi:hypothetical protein SMALB_0417 [Streptomyces malaysiensis]|uniref:Uncharacterized protein n=1 Tax=Streptomyces malaysiensis TaxID=92644 RepID=A0A7X5WYC6_STRMQ|nr:hypothetical protein [Streptomyces malaysiensis]